MSKDAFTRDIEKRINAAIAHVERDERKAKGWCLPTAKNVIARIRKGLSPHVGKHHDPAVDKCLQRLRDKGVIAVANGVWFIRGETPKAPEPPTPIDVSGFRLELCPKPKHRTRGVHANG